MRRGTYKHVALSLAIGGFLLLGLLLAPNDVLGIVRAAPIDLFVTPGGEGDCSQGDPCHLHVALSQAVDGDSLYLSQGT